MDFCGNVVRGYQTIEPFPMGFLAALHDAQINKSLTLIHAHPESNWTLEKMARAAAGSAVGESAGGPSKRPAYTSNKVAKSLLEFSTSIPRTQLRPSYGEGFLGAPIQIGMRQQRPTPPA